MLNLRVLCKSSRDESESKQFYIHMDDVFELMESIDGDPDTRKHIEDIINEIKAVRNSKT